MTAKVKLFRQQGWPTPEMPSRGRVAVTVANDVEPALRFATSARIDI